MLLIDTGDEVYQMQCWIVISDRRFPVKIKNQIFKIVPIFYGTPFIITFLLSNYVESQKFLLFVPQPQKFLLFVSQPQKFLH